MTDQTANGDFNTAARNDGILPIDFDVVAVEKREIGPSGHAETVFVHSGQPLDYRRPWQRDQNAPAANGAS